jgi:ApbE superfamily uncharacterized protein (UPF0280 family)
MSWAEHAEKSATAQEQSGQNKRLRYGRVMTKSELSNAARLMGRKGGKMGVGPAKARPRAMAQAAVVAREKKREERKRLESKNGGDDRVVNDPGDEC